MTSNGYWVNNKHVRFKNIIKPCRFCGFCPYGQLVEDFPLDPPSRASAVEHNNHLKQLFAAGKFDNDLDVRKNMEESINNFDKKNYPVKYTRSKMSCKVFGHYCPVYYHAELVAEDDEITQEEIDIFKKEIDEYKEKLKITRRKK
jgi:hypothetical protein